MHIVHIEERRHKDIGMVLHHLLDRYEKGLLRGVALCVKDNENDEDIYITGVYRKDTGAALGAAMRMSLQINEQ